MGKWTTTTTFTETTSHEIKYHFTCPHCNHVTPETPKTYELTYQPSVILAGYQNQAQLSETDTAAITQTAKNRLRTLLINDYISAERGEFAFIKAQCPMCSAAWQWQPKKKLFSRKRPEPVGEEYRPVINWNFDGFYSGFSDEVAQLKAKLPGLFINDGFLRGYYSDEHNAEECYKFVVPGLRAAFLNDLMGNDHPVEALPYQAVKTKDAPPLDNGETGYGFFDGIVTRWVIVKNGVVVRKA